MRLCRFDHARLGLVLDSEVADVSAVLDELPPLRWPLPRGDRLIAALPQLRPRIEALARSAPRRDLAQLALHSPVANPGKIIAAPVNYRRHQEESRADAGISLGAEVHTIERYGLFLKATSALVGPGEPVIAQWPDRRLDHELELALVIGRGGRDIAEARALEHVAGYAIGLDMSIRGQEDRSLRKSLDTFAVVGPWLVTADEISDPSALDLTLYVNEELRQRANTRDLIWGCARLVAFASSVYTLDPGDILLTGTPEGVGPVQAGDTMTCRIEGIGEMRVEVVAAR